MQVSFFLGIFPEKRDAEFTSYSESGMVFGGVQSRGDLGYDILGGTWLKGVYAVSFVFFSLRIDGQKGKGRAKVRKEGKTADMMQIFDQGNKRFGVVQRKF